MKNIRVLFFCIKVHITMEKIMKKITGRILEKFKKYLYKEEKSHTTASK